MTNQLNHVLLMMGGEGGGGFGPLVFIGFFFLIIYFFMIRPQTRKAKEQRNFAENLKKGDRVVTIGGIHGKILDIADDSYLIEVDQNVKLRVEKSVISLDFTRALLDRTSGKAPAERKK
jgi:preprotein translocase subunit YajC